MLPCGQVFACSSWWSSARFDLSERGSFYSFTLHLRVRAVKNLTMWYRQGGDARLGLIPKNAWKPQKFHTPSETYLMKAILPVYNERRRPANR